MKMAAGFHLAVGCLWALFMVWFLLVIGGVPDSLIGWAKETLIKLSAFHNRSS